ncbi:hypothetical protein [Streptomyces sp. NPDC058701]|uniref:hypothetical protein n=1 Tax=Streptomyces sp. NPDC058701 TaxID=3346608 RepID=UPI0036641F79
MENPPQQPASPPYVPPPYVPPPYAPPPAASPSRVKIWAAGAAVVSAIAGVATAVAAFSNGPSQPAAVPPPTSSAVGGQPSQSPENVPATGADGAAAVAVRWSGKVVLGLEGLDLSQVPPSKGTSLGVRPAAGRNGSSSMEVKGTVALWENTGDPTPQGCKDLLASQSRNAIVVAEGDSVCLVNEASPIALLKVTATRYKEGSYGLIEGQLTVWNLRAAR